MCIDSFQRNLSPKKPKWIDTQFLRVSIVSALAVMLKIKKLFSAIYNFDVYRIAVSDNSPTSMEGDKRRYHWSAAAACDAFFGARWWGLNVARPVGQSPSAALSHHPIQGSFLEWPIEVNKEPSIYDVRKIFWILDPPSPSVCISRNLSVLFVRKIS